MPPTSFSRRERVADAAAELMVQISRLLANQAFSRGLAPPQWSALRYLASANESARLISVFAKYHATTASSASQTVSALVQRALVRKRRGADGRSYILELTAKGRRKLAEDPIKVLSGAIQRLPDHELFLLAECLTSVTRKMRDAGEGDAEARPS